MTPPPASALRRAGVLIVAAKLALVPVVADIGGADAFALPKSAVSRALAYVLFAFVVGYVVRHRERVPRGRIWYAVGAVVVVNSLATAFALDQTTALFGAHRRYLGLTSLLDGALLAFAVALFVRERKDLVILGVGALAGSMAVTAYAVVQIAGLDPVRWSDPTFSSLVGNSTSLAAYLMVCVAAIALLLLVSWAEFDRRLRLGLLVLAITAGGVTVLTGARAPTLALLPALVFSGALAFRARRIALRVDPRLAAVAGAVLVAGAALFATGVGGERVMHLIQGRDVSVSERSVIYTTSLRALATRPILGVGPDGLASVYSAQRPAETARLPQLAPTQTSTHSWALHHLLGAGVLGLAAFLLLAGAALARGWVSARTGAVAPLVGSAAIVAYLIQGLVTINSVPVELLFWTSVGLAAWSPLPAGTSTRARARRGASDTTLLIGASILGLAAAVTVLGELEANRAVLVSERARAAGELTVADRAARTAVERDPRRAHYWNALGQVHSRRQPERAIAAFSRAAEQAPLEPVYVINLAAEEAFASQQNASHNGSAVGHAQTAVALDPNGPETLRRAAEVFAFLQRFDLAIDALDRVDRLTPDDRAARLLRAAVLTERGMPAEAIGVLERLYGSDPALAGAPRISWPPEIRLPLSALYQRAGRADEARSLVRPPEVVDADAACSPRAGSALVITSGVIRPRCFRVVFASEAALQGASGAPGAVTDPARYVLDGRPLPAGTTIELSESTVTAHLPAEAAPVASGTLLVVRSVANVMGQVMDPASVAVRIR